MNDVHSAYQDYLRRVRVRFHPETPGFPVMDEKCADPVARGILDAAVLELIGFLGCFGIKPLSENFHDIFGGVFSVDFNEFGLARTSTQQNSLNGLSFRHFFNWG